MRGRKENRIRSLRLIDFFSMFIHISTVDTETASGGQHIIFRFFLGDFLLRVSRMAGFSKLKERGDAKKQ